MGHHESSKSRSHGQPKATSSSSKSSKSSKPSVPAYQSSSSRGHLKTTFLFVVNELQLSDQYLPTADTWGNEVPPVRRAYYAPELAGEVYRFHNGTITPADNYFWHRPGGPGTPGNICYCSPAYDEDGNPAGVDFIPVEAYKICSVFDCGPFLPCVYAGVDPTIQDMAFNDAGYDRFWPVHFAHRGRLTRLDQQGPFKYIGSQSAGWLGSLVPTTYRNPDPAAPATSCLGGDLGLLLGMMGLAELPLQTNRIGLHWNQYRWTGPPRSLRTAHAPPRGVLVHIALEPNESCEGRGPEDLADFEAYETAVQG
ncbi:hypothetical protein F4778DRAFT_9509 [Xylariomycetidae sp. FL2044]|nr:hypothetical protein F4778DRAFT_9509 [Xylariomycetidae sp. FL2044]